MPLEAMILIGLLLFCMVGGMPIVWSMLLASVVTVLVDGTLPFALVGQRMFASMNQVVMLAVPAFIFAGDIMAQGGISKRIADFANSIVGGISGSMSIISLITSTFFSAVSGSSIATTASVGAIMLPELEKRGYKKDYAAALQAVGGTLGVVIPPSILSVVYGMTTNTNISHLLLAGVVPGILACVCLCLVAWITAKRNRFPKEKMGSIREILHTFKNAVWALLTPIIILGGIYAGIFTPTESAVVAVVWGIIAACLIYKELPIKQLPGVMFKSARSIGSLLLLITSAQFFSFLMNWYGVTTMFGAFFIENVSSKVGFILIVYVVLLICGMFIDAGSSVLILGPMFYPVAIQYGFHPVHWGMFFIFLVALGQTTPPFGVCLFTANSISGVSVATLSRKAMPFLLILFGLAMLYGFIPWFSTCLIGS